MVYIYIIFSAIVFGGDQKIALEKIRAIVRNCLRQLFEI